MVDPQRCRFIRVENLPNGCTDAELWGLFEPFGKVESARFRGCTGLIEMSCTREASLAIRELVSASLRNAALNVQFDSSRNVETQPSAAATGKSCTRDRDGSTARDLAASPMLRQLLNN